MGRAPENAIAGSRKNFAISARPGEASRRGLRVSWSSGLPQAAESPTRWESSRKAPMNRRERRVAARKSKKASQGASAATAAALCVEALAHLQAGRLFDAQLSCQRALAIDPA